MDHIFIEAESFRQLGGWVVDTASMEHLHSAYVMAHGMGIPVEDAITEFTIAEDGEYRIWALTRDWTAVWNVKESAGRYVIKIDGTPLAATLGTNGPDWAWQSAGTVFLSTGQHSLALHDLTGFNGRCDAILITDPAETPDSSLPALDLLRKELNWKELCTDAQVYDLIVVGGGIAGICTALAAHRKGCSVALLNDRPVLGGCNSSEIRVCMGGQIKHPPYEHIGDIVQEIAPVMGHPSIYREEYFEDARKLFAFQVPNGNGAACNVLLNESVTAIEQDGRTISAVICTNTHSGLRTKLRAKLFTDCSGDGILARLAGAELMYGTEGKNEFGEQLAPAEHKHLVMGQSIRWYSEEQPEACSFPDLDWNLHFDENSYLNCLSGDWEQETGFTRDMIRETEYIRDYGLRAIYANWSYQKNHCVNKERFAHAKLKWVSAFGGKRESCRVKGDYILTQHDFEDGITHADGTAKITWGIDIHYPEPINEDAFGEAFRSFAYHRNMPAACPVPYRCLYSRDVGNLFLGGRLISTSHIAFSAVRVMRTLGMLGEVAGIAAALCTRFGCLPRDIYTTHLDELKREMKQGVTIPAAFACGGIGNDESYHFKDIGWWNLRSGICADNGHRPRKPENDEIEKFRYCVERLGIEHQYPIPETWD